MKPVDVPVHQWHRNGDHPDDYRTTITDLDGTTYSPEYRRDHDWEGDVVRAWNHPPVDPHTGETSASSDAVDMGPLPHCDVPAPHSGPCSHTMNMHGWIDHGDHGHTVCPGDWIVTDDHGDHYPVKGDLMTEPPTTLGGYTASEIAAAMKDAIEIDVNPAESTGQTWHDLPAEDQDEITATVQYTIARLRGTHPAADVEATHRDHRPDPPGSGANYREGST